MSSSSIAMIPSPGMGHLIPLIQLADILSKRHGVSTTFIIISTTKNPPPAHQISFLELSLQQNCDYIVLPTTGSLSGGNGNDNDGRDGLEDVIIHSLTMSLPSILSTLHTLQQQKQKLEKKKQLAGIIIDAFGLDLADFVAKELGLPTYVFFGTAAMNLLFSLHLREIDLEAGNKFDNYEDMTEPVRLPGCVPLHGRDIGDPFRDRTTHIYKLLLAASQKFLSADGILINTFDGLEPGGIKAYKEEDPGRPPLYPIGPVVGSSGGSCSEKESGRSGGGFILEWLDSQPKGSVVFVSFGSGGTLSYRQTSELAHGLEKSRQRFLWVLREPSDATSCPSYCDGGDQADDDDDDDKKKKKKVVDAITAVFQFLPEGFSFVERVKGRGLVVHNWAPQVEVLSHASTGAFVTHCGWNSAMESIMCGVPMVAWPLYAEQRTNAVLLADDLKVAIRPRRTEQGVVESVEVARVVEEVIMGGDEGQLVRMRAKELKDAAEKALGEAGTSTKALQDLVSRLEESPLIDV